MTDRCEAGDQSCLPAVRPPEPGCAHEPAGVRGHRHDHTHGRGQDRRRLLVALGLAAVIFVAELVGGLASRSLSLVSDAGHVFADMSGLLISLLAMLCAAAPATARRTFGYQRLEILAAVVNGVLLVTLAVIVGFAAIHRLGTPTHVDAGIMLPIAAVGLVANLGGAWVLHGSHSLNARSAYLHVLSDTLSSAAVVVGGILIAVDPRLSAIDPILGLVIAAIVVLGAFRLLREGIDVLLEAVPRGVDPEAVRAGVKQVPGILDVHDLHIWTITSGLVALSAHVVVADAAACDSLLRQVKDFLARQHRISHSTIQIESTAYEHGSD